MLNVREISRLLTANADDRLCKRWALATPNGTLLANSDTADMRGLRKHIALVTLTWKDHTSPTGSGDFEGRDGGQPSDRPPLKAITIESDSNNVIAVQIQADLLLILEGGVPPRRQGFESRISAEREGDPAQPDAQTDSLLSRPGTPGSSISTSSVAAGSVLRHQRQRLGAVAEVIRDELEAAGFEMPTQGTGTMF